LPLHKNSVQTGKNISPGTAATRFKWSCVINFRIIIIIIIFTDILFQIYREVGRQKNSENRRAFGTFTGQSIVTHSSHWLGFLDHPVFLSHTDAQDKKSQKSTTHLQWVQHALACHNDLLRLFLNRQRANQSGHFLGRLPLGQLIHTARTHIQCTETIRATTSSAVFHLAS